MIKLRRIKKLEKEREMIRKQVITIWDEKETRLIFTLLGRMSTNTYVGIGFSKDEVAVYEGMYDTLVVLLKEKEDG